MRVPAFAALLLAFPLLATADDKPVVVKLDKLKAEAPPAWKSEKPKFTLRSYQFRLRGPAPSHRNDHDVAPGVAQQAGGVAGDRGLADPLAGADHRQRRHGDRPAVRRPQLEVRALVGEARRQRIGRQPHAPLLGQNRIVGKVKHALGSVTGGGGQHR